MLPLTSTLPSKTPALRGQAAAMRTARKKRTRDLGEKLELVGHGLFLLLQAERFVLGRLVDDAGAALGAAVGGVARAPAFLGQGDLLVGGDAEAGDVPVVAQGRPEGR